MKNQNRYGKYSQTRLPRQKKTIIIPGSLEDDGKYYRCWNCGFICDKDRDIVERGNMGTAGVVPTHFGHAREEYLVDSDGEYTLDESGDEIIVAMGSYYPEITKGCPFCGSTNYR